jgi:hypothetical protein
MDIQVISSHNIGVKTMLLLGRIFLSGLGRPILSLLPGVLEFVLLDCRPSL